MCGIVGFVDKSKNKKKTIKSMMKLIEHRGPDENGYYIHKDIVLGHQRLSIIDLNSGHQPMLTEDESLVIVFNGEIYNYKELKKKLSKKYKFVTTSDTEVLLYLYKEYGNKMLNYLRGMFAFVIYDKKDNSLFGARDYFGIKPFYYYKTEETFMFASEMKAFLTHPLFKKELNEDVLPFYLSFNYVPTEEKLIKNVFSLSPGHYFIYKNGRLNIKKYFELSFKEKNNKNVVKDIEDVMKDSVQHHMISDVPVGSFLSSGIDSSYIVSLAKPNNTYTLGYKEKKYSEISYAQDLTNKLGISNKYKIVSKKDYFKVLKKVIYHMDEPVADPSIVSLYYVAKLASKDVKVALSGEGADEFFGGYNTYGESNSLAFYNKIPFCIRHFIAKIAEYLPEIKGKDFLYRRGNKLENYYIGVEKVFNERERNKVLNKKCKIKNSEITKEAFSLVKNKSNMIKMQIIDIKFWLQYDILQKGDKMSMASSLEVRPPFVDKEVFNLASSLKSTDKIYAGTTKYALREASKSVILNESYKKKKLGFPVPLREWLKSDDVYKDILNKFDSKISKKLFNNKRLHKLLKSVHSGKNPKYKKVWNIYTFLIWYQIFFEEN